MNGTMHDDPWGKLAAPLPREAISWRQDGKSTPRDGKYFARFVCYVEAGTVRERLDSVVPGEWDLTLEPLPPMAYTADEETTVSFKAKLQVLGVIREDVGTGKDYKSASTDAFKRAAVRFGIGHELYAFEQNWVEVDGDGKYAKPLVDPQQNYERKHGSGAEKTAATIQASSVAREATAPEKTGGLTLPAHGEKWDVKCPKCGGQMWDNRIGKRNPKAPDAKCRDKKCDGVIWPAKEGEQPRGGTSRGDLDPENIKESLQATDAELEELPF